MKIRLKGSKVIMQLHPTHAQKQNQKEFMEKIKEISFPSNYEENFGRTIIKKYQGLVVSANYIENH